VAVGLALQGALSNFAGGLMILIFKPFKVGDFIENGAVMGTVKDITIIYTILHTVDNKVVTIPNGTLTNSNVINYSALPSRRVDIKFSAGYHDDIEKVKSVLMGVAEAHEKVLKDPAPFVRLTAQGSSSLDYTFRVWCAGPDYWDVYFDMMERVKMAFDENGISIPFQQVDVHMDK
jgi:small conductance mechanosensitive channel